jgi:hypothetical protein
MRSFFTPNKPRQFDPKPRYYSEEKERIDELKRRIGENAADEELRSERMREAFARKRMRRVKPNNKLLSGSKILMYVFLVILLIILVNNVRFLLF